MINRQNWLDVREYLKHCERKQNEPTTVERYRNSLRHLLEWADETLLTKARGIDPLYPTYLSAARSDGRNSSLAPASIQKGLAHAKQFFHFARSEWPQRYKGISEPWIELLRPPRALRSEARLPARQFYTLEEILKIAAVSTETLRQERGKVGACMLFLSGMRADALASLPIQCVDLERHAIHQLPERGVRTKNSKAAITYLLQIDELQQVIRSWDTTVRRCFPPTMLWYSNLTRDGMTLVPTSAAFIGRYHVIEDDLRIICALAGVRYQSPHKLRHGHTVHALKRARNMAQLKAISQNIMHSSVVITDQVYGKLINDDVHDIIAGL